MSLPAPLQAVAGAGVAAWVVGGAVRDRLLDRETVDFDVVVAADPEPVARAAGRAARGHAFALSEAFGAWRVVDREHRWQLDVLGLADSIEEDLARRDLTINAIAQRLDGAAAPDGPYVDPFGGVGDIASRRLRMVGPDAFADDPLRVLRLARFAAQLRFEVDPATAQRAQRSAAGLAGVAPERAFAEFRALICADGVLDGLALADRLGATAALLPELAALDGVAQSRFHHLDVAGHTRAVLSETVALTGDLGRLGLAEPDETALRTALHEPLANELTRAQALRFGALLHDIAKPETRAVTGEGRVTFMGHDARGARMATEILSRLRASERLAVHVAQLCRHHLTLGFLVHRMPLGPHDVYGYLDACDPVGVDVTVLSVADRVATRGDNAERAIELHLELAREMLPAALRWEAEPPRPPIRGDVLAGALGIAPGPALGALLSRLRAAAFAGEVTSAEQAIDRARELLSEIGADE